MNKQLEISRIKILNRFIYFGFFHYEIMRNRIIKITNEEFRIIQNYSGKQTLSYFYPRLNPKINIQLENNVSKLKTNIIFI